MAGDLFLHDWDERFHANVAKNIVEHPFSPVLYDDTILEYNFSRWSESRLWLSKPLFPFWITGASISIFGANEFGLRFPSIIIGLLSIWLTFRIGLLLFDQRAALIAAFLHAIHGLTLELNGGLISSDHVDVLFTFLFQACLFSYLLFNNSGKRKYLILAGALIGLAFLTKWVMVFFLIVIIATVHLKKVTTSRQYIKHLTVLAFVAIGIASPWLIYLWQYHPEELRITFLQFFERMDTGYEGHSGGALAYFEKVSILFGAGVFLPMLWIMASTLKKYDSGKFFIAVWLLLPIILLSFFDTKRSTYLMMCSPACFLLTGLFIGWIAQPQSDFFGIPKWAKITLVILLLGLPVHHSIERTKPFKLRFVTPEWKTALSNFINENDQEGNKIILSGEPHALEAMYYYDVLAYERRLTEEEKEKFIAAGYTVIAGRNHE